MEIIQAGEEHILIIQEIAYSTWPETFKDILSPAQLTYMLQMMYSNEALNRQMEELHHTFLLVKSQDEFCGYISYQHNYKNNPETKIHKLYVLPSAQGRGVGKALLLAAIDAARVVKNHTITLNVNKYNTALKFYNLLGFEEAGYEDIDIGNGFLMEDVILHKKL